MPSTPTGAKRSGNLRDEKLHAETAASDIDANRVRRAIKEITALRWKTKSMSAKEILDARHKGHRH